MYLNTSTVACDKRIGCKDYSHNKRIGVTATTTTNKRMPLVAHAGKVFFKSVGFFLLLFGSYCCLRRRGNNPQGTVWLPYGTVNSEYGVRRAPTARTRTRARKILNIYIYIHTRVPSSPVPVCGGMIWAIVITLFCLNMHCYSMDIAFQRDKKE